MCALQAVAKVGVPSGPGPLLTLPRTTALSLASPVFPLHQLFTS